MAVKIRPVSSRVMDAPRPPYGRGIVLIGTSSQGPAFTPIQAVSAADAASVFGEGELVDALGHLQKMDPNLYPWLIRLGGEELDENDKADLLPQAYEQMLDVSAQIVVPLGIRHKADGPDFLGDLAYFLSELDYPYRMIGILETPPIDSEDVKASVTDILSLPRLYSSLGEAGMNVALATPPLFLRGGGEQVSASAALAALIAGTPLHDSPTNKRIASLDLIDYRLQQGVWEQEVSFAPSGEAVRLKRRCAGSALIEGFEEEKDYAITDDGWSLVRLAGSEIPTGESLTVRFEYSDLDSLAAAGITTFFNRPARGAYTAPVVNLGPKEHRSLSTTRSLHAILWLIDQAASPFYGRPATSEGEDIAVEQAIGEALEYAIDASIIRNCEAEFVWEQSGLTLLITLWPWHEIAFINVETSLRVL